MCGWGGEGWMWNGGWGSWMVTAVMAVLFFAVLITAIVLAARYLGGSHHTGATGSQQPRTAEDVLAERLARGEIDDTEYRQRMTALREHR